MHSRHLRMVQPDDETVAIKLLSDRRKELVGLRTQAACRLHRLLRELIPGGGPALITAEKAFDLVNDLKRDDPAGQMRVEYALEHIEDIMRIDLKIDAIAKRIHAEIKASGTTLTRVYGIGPINAAVIIGEVGDVSRFPSRDHFASYTGTAPVAASSGDHHRHRFNRAGNRQLNHALTSPRSPRSATTHPGATTTDQSSPPARAQRSTALPDAPHQRRRLATAPTRPDTRPDPRPSLAPLAFQARRSSAISITRHAAHEWPTTTLQTRSGLTSTPGSGCGLTEASAPRRKLITPADRKVQQTSSSAHPEPTS